MLSSRLLPPRMIRGYSLGYGNKSYKSILRKKGKKGTTDKTSRDRIFHLELQEALKQKSLNLDQVKIPEKLIYDFLFTHSAENIQIENVEIIAQTNEGEGIGLISRGSEDAITVVKVPKTLVGDVVSVVLRRHHEYFAEAELLLVSKVSSKRKDNLVICGQFDSCSGCQFQMLSYEDQLEVKKGTIEKAYRYFYPELKSSEVPDFGLMVGSPMQFAYRTKLTPHTKIPRGLDRLMLPLPLGFEDIRVGKLVVDIVSCPIAVSSINAMLPEVKRAFQKEVEEKLEDPKKRVDDNYILRDSMRVDHATGEYENVCLTKRKSVATEEVEGFVFQFGANNFFQNNRFILPEFLAFLKFQLANILYQYLVDAYCGCGFLGISLSGTLPEYGKVFGIEIAKEGIEYGKHNAGLNGLKMPDKIEFVNGNSDAMFTHETFLQSGIKGEDLVLLMNPSRKGSSEEFMKQLLEFKPKAIVYISCNVFSQARDLADFEKFQLRSEVKYRVKSVTGFDFYPQTKHVESVAILERI